MVEGEQGTTDCDGPVVLGCGRATCPVRGSDRDEAGSDSAVVSPPAMNESSNVGTCGKHLDFVASSVNASRSACRLRWLNGAAPVCYGVPTVFSNQE